MEKITNAEENTFNEIRSLADLDDAIDRIADEDAGWGIPLRLVEGCCEIFQDLVAPSVLKVRWVGSPRPDQYARLYSSAALPLDAERIDWNRGPQGVWEVFRCPSMDVH